MATEPLWSIFLCLQSLVGLELMLKHATGQHAYHLSCFSLVKGRYFYLISDCKLVDHCCPINRRMPRSPSVSQLSSKGCSSKQAHNWRIHYRADISSWMSPQRGGHTWEQIVQKWLRVGREIQNILVCAFKISICGSFFCQWKLVPEFCFKPVFYISCWCFKFNLIMILYFVSGKCTQTGWSKTVKVKIIKMF